MFTTYRDWTPLEDHKLRDWVDRYSYEEIAKMLPSRTASAVKKRAYRLGIGRKPRGVAWTPEEDAVLQEFNGKITVERIARKLPRRTASAVYSRLQALGLPTYRDDSQWTPKEDAILRAAPTAREAARILDRSFKACCVRRDALRKREREYDDEPVKPLTFTPTDELEILQREHPGESYRNLRIPSEGVVARRFIAPLAFTVTGSTGAMCAEAV